jgi:hypothetical protein
MPTAHNLSNPLTSAQVIDILKACAEAKVFEIQFQDLRVKFGEGRNETLPPADFATSEQTTSSDTILSAKHDEMTRESVEIDELRFREEQLALLQIEDPLAAERMFLDGELGEEEFDDVGADESD